MVNAYSQGKGCRLGDTPHHLPTRRNYTIMVGEDVHEDLIALDQRRTNQLTVPSQCGDVINSIVIVIIFNITNNLTIQPLGALVLELPSTRSRKTQRVSYQSIVRKVHD